MLNSDHELQNQPICWLHISDFHTGKDEHGQKEAFKYVCQEVEEKLRDGMCPDLIFITGDIANYGKKEEYVTFFNALFYPLTRVLGDNILERIYIIPGNHDVDRTQAEDVWIRTLLEEKPKILEPSSAGWKLRQNLAKRFENYAQADIHEFIKINGNWIFSVAGCYTDIITIKGYRIGILGLNTAWAAGAKDDEGHLSPGKGIVEDGLECLKDCSTRIVLGHHAIDWFLKKDQEAQAIRALFGKYHVIYLHGDLHENNGFEETGAGSKFLTIETGAVFQAQEDELLKNRLMWGEILPSVNKLRFHARQWFKGNQEWIDDGKAFPNIYKEKGTDHWLLDLPGTSQQAKQATVTPIEDTKKSIQQAPVLQLPPGWSLLEREELETIKAEALKDIEASKYYEVNMYFNGIIPTWREALTPAIPRRKIVAELRGILNNARKKEATCVVRLTGGGGEGKSTVLRQVVCDLLLEQTEWNILWHSDPETPLTYTDIKSLPKNNGTWLITSDDAEYVAGNISSILRKLREEHRQDIHFLLCGRESDWYRELQSRDKEWSGFALYQTRQLDGLKREDALLIAQAWWNYRSGASPEIQVLPPAIAADQLYNNARQRSGPGSFLGALIQMRFGEGLVAHVAGILESLKKTEAPGGTLLDAFARITTLHADNFLMLTKPVLATALKCPLPDLKPHVITPLGREASIEEDGSYIYTRHRSIAEEARKILEDAYGYDFDEIYKELLAAAVETRKNGIYVLELGKSWYTLPQRLFALKKKSLAISLAELLVRLEDTDPLHVEQLARLYRNTDQTPRAVELFRSTFSKSPQELQDSLYFHEWSAVEGKAKNFGVSAWLDGLALADGTPTPRREDNYSEADRVKISLYGLSFAFEGLFNESGRNAIFGNAWGAATHLGRKLPPSYETSDTEERMKQSDLRRKNEHIADVTDAAALSNLIEGILTCANQFERQLSDQAIRGRQLTFNNLARFFGPG